MYFTFFLSVMVEDDDVVKASDLAEASECVLSDKRVVTVVLLFVLCGVPIVPSRPTILPINRLDDRASPIVAVLSERGRPPVSLVVDDDLSKPSFFFSTVETRSGGAAAAAGGAGVGGSREGSC